MNYKLLWLICFTGITSAAYPASIAVNIVGDSSNPARELVPTDSAGLLAQANWNNLIHTAIGDGANSGTLSNVVDNLGAGTTLDILTSAWGGAPDATNKTYGPTVAPYGWIGAEQNMHISVASVDVLVTINQIPYAAYDIYVYMGGGFNGGNYGANAMLGLAPGGTGLVDTSHYYMFGYQGTNYIQATSTSSGSAGNGNYFRFSNNSATDVQLFFDSTNAYFEGGIAGIQIVAVPEPSTYALLGVGLGLLVLSRRRSPSVSS